MAFNGYLIAEAYATLGIDDRKFASGLNAAGVKWDAFSKKMNSALNFGGMNTGLANFRTALIRTRDRADDLTKSLDRLATAANSVNRAMGGGTMKAMNANVVAEARAAAIMLKAQAQAHATMMRANRAASRGGGGAGAAASVGMFSGMAAGLREAMGLIRQMSPLLTPFRMIFSGMGMAFSKLAPGLSAAAGTFASLMRKVGGETVGWGKAWVDIVGSGVKKFIVPVGAAVLAPFRLIGIALRPVTSILGMAGRSLLTPLRAIGSVLSSAFRTAGGVLARAIAAPLKMLTSAPALLAGAVVGGIGGFGAVELIKNSANMELSFARVRRAAEFTDDEFRTFRKDLLDFGNVTNGVKLENLFEIANVGAKIGISGDQLNLFTRDMAKVRIAISEADLPTEEMAERIGSLISVFHRGNDEAIRFASALNALDLKSVASAREILDVSGRMSGTASLLGMKPQEVLALSTALRQARVPIETAGTAMQQIMGRMASRKDSPQFARIAGMKEKPFLKLVGTDPLKAIIKIEEGLKRLDKITAIRALDQLGLDGQRVRGTLLQLGTVLPQLNDYVKVSNREWTTFASIAESVATIGETLWGHWEKVKTNFATLADAMGKGFLPVLKELADAVSRLMQDMRESFERNKEVLGPWFRWMTEKVQMIGVVWRAWPSFVDLATHTIGEKLDQAAHVFTRFAALVSATMQELGRDIGDYFADIGDNIAIAINNATPFSKKLTPKEAVMGRGRLPVGHRAGDAAAKALGDRDVVNKAGERVQLARPGAGFNVFGGAMPNRTMQKEKAQGEINAAIQDQKLDDWQARQDMRLKDEAARANAERLRRPLEAPGRKRRGVDLSVLRPGPTGVDPVANMKRAAILGANRAAPALRVGGPRLGELAGPDVDVRRNLAMGIGGGGAFQAAKRRARLAVPLAFRDTHVDPAMRDFMGPLPAEVNPVSAVQMRNRPVGGAIDATGSRDGTARIGRGAQAANRQFKEWRRQENLRMRGRVDLRDSGDGALRGPGIKVQDKEKGIEEVLTENKLQTKELTEIKTALNEIKARPAMTV